MKRKRRRETENYFSNIPVRPLHSKDNLEQELSNAAVAADGFPIELLDDVEPRVGVLFNCVEFVVVCFVKCNEPLLVQDALEELPVIQVVAVAEVLQVSGGLFAFVTVCDVQFEGEWETVEAEEVCAVNEVIEQVFKELL